MNYIWSGMILISVVCGFANGSLEAVGAAAMEGAGAAVSAVLPLAGAMCFWTGFMKIAERSGASGAVERIIAPAVKRLFRGADAVTRKYISMNMSANLLGMGNAATPMGIRAMAEMEKSNPSPSLPTKNMCMLVAVNTASIQLIPTTILALRSAAGSSAPGSVIVPVWIASAAGFIAAAAAVKLFIREPEA